VRLDAGDYAWDETRFDEQVDSTSHLLVVEGQDGKVSHGPAKA
jgi:hypothetical protein